ncbi:MAG: relaxase/mobilization nuclease domain-containing protein [Xenococcus sp. (in: cyanobacteria)]
MIGKITTGSNFKSLFNYLLKKGKEAQILGGDFLLLEPNIKRLANQFDWVAQTRLTTKKPVKHLSISFAPEDGQVSSKTKVEISKKVVNELGYDNNQWVVIAHQRNDPDHDWQHEHDHIHIVVNGINLDGERVKDSFDKTRLEKILRNLEQEHGLTKVISSNQCNRHRPNTNQLRRYQRETKEYNQKKQDTPPEIPVMAKLEAAIDAASSDRPTMTVFIGRLQHLGIDVRPSITDKGRKRISYALEELKVRGSKIHNGSFPKLISQRGIDFNETRDTPALEAAFKGKTVTVKSEQLLSWSKINQGSRFFSASKKNTLDLNYWLPNPLKVSSKKDSNQEIADPKQWKNLQQKLLDNYGIPEQISTGLQKNNSISANKQGNPIWHKYNFLNSKDDYFWFEANYQENLIKKLVVTSSPVEAVSAYLVDKLIKENHSPCVFVSLDKPEQLNELDLTEFDNIVVSSNDRQIFPDNIPKLVVEEDVNTWQQSWLICWNEIQKIMELEAKEAEEAESARKKNLLSKKERQLEL